MSSDTSNGRQPKLSYDAQLKLIEFAQRHDVELTRALKKAERTFDDLVYENSGTKQWAGEKPKKLDDFACELNGIPFVSFFTGCGGIDLGFETAGFNHVAAFEFSELFCKTLRRNRPEWNIFGPPTSSGDVSNVDETISILQEMVALEFDGVFIGGPPCQPFSIAASQRFSKWGDNYKRVGFENEDNGNLLFSYVQLIEHFKPACFILENVTGLRDLDGGEQLTSVLERLKCSGYAIHGPVVLNAADFGVPQSRERLFVVGSKIEGSFTFPQAAEQHIGCGSVLPRDKGLAENNETRNHKLSSILRYMKLDYGKRDQLGRVDRLDPSLPAKTVIAGGTLGGGRSHLHPEIPRTLSVRECARLQTFPDDYVFVGSTARQFTQVGNAVPPVLAAQIAIAIAESVFGIRQA